MASITGTQFQAQERPIAHDVDAARLFGFRLAGSTLSEATLESLPSFLGTKVGNKLAVNKLETTKAE